MKPLQQLTLCLLILSLIIGGCGLNSVSTMMPVEVQASKSVSAMALPASAPPRIEAALPVRPGEFNREQYERRTENPFLDVLQNPLSTFSVDVDTASYANLRRILNSNALPPPDSVRIEEMLNYFSYDYPQPQGEEPFAFVSELSDAPWASSHRLLHIGLQGKQVQMAQAPASNLVFLVDVSGSMNEPAKLPLLVASLKMLVGELRPQDSVAIVVYAGAAGIVLPATPGSEKGKIIAALDSLTAGGSTSGGEGIQLAYRIARENFRKDGNNRVILCTDGDFNVGPSSDGELERLIEKKRGDGIFLTVLGFGSGNYQDAKMQKLADHGNGNYAYIDGLLEARKVLVRQMGGTLHTIAKDVKIQIEFNPAKVKAYRLIGYEKRMLRAEDFSDDKKDAGEIGAGHTVTALYEIIPADGAATATESRYLQTEVKGDAAAAAELALIKFRYKKPDEETSRLISVPIAAKGVALDNSSENFRFAASVAGWGMLLGQSDYRGAADNELVLKLARGAKGSDELGYRAEMIRLVELSGLLKK